MYRQKQLISTASNSMALPGGAPYQGTIHLVGWPVEHRYTSHVHLMALDKTKMAIDSAMLLSI